MDRNQFDHFCRIVGVRVTRRGTLRGLAAVGLLAGAPLMSPTEAGAGRRRRRKARRRHRTDRQDRRQDRRQARKERLPQGPPPGYDCSKPDSQGKPCLYDSQGGVVLRCCNGACPAIPDTCIGTRGYTTVPCSDATGGDCRGADHLCCSQSAMCIDEEGLCVCWYGDPGDFCATDGDCNPLTPACVCGMCQ
ncbi:MAG: hypothetical protein KC442_04800 [Thermomicrobiales bacterium]|nr:hypothetical protein [Thermomicrobiales bacterium]